MLYNAIILNNAEKYPHKIAIYDMTSPSIRSYTYSDLKTKIDILANNLSNIGLKQGDKLAFYLPNCIEGVYLLFACFKLGVQIIPIRHTLGTDDVAFMLKDASPDLFIFHENLQPKLKSLIDSETSFTTKNKPIVYQITQTNAQFKHFNKLMHETIALNPIPDVKGACLATIFYTSGTTGAPKGAVHNQAQWLCNSEVSAVDYHPQDSVYIALSLYHGYGLGQGILPALLKGATVVLNSHFDPNHFIKLLSHEQIKITHFYAVPSMYTALAHCLPKDRSLPHHLKLLDVAGDLMLDEVKTRLEKALQITPRTSFGMTEIMYVSSGPIKFGSPANIIGQPSPPVEYRLYKDNQLVTEINTPGELHVKSPTVLLHYHNGIPSNQIDGFFPTGDYVMCDSQGQLTFLARAKQLIKGIGGYEINPREIENCIARNEHVKEVCVVGVNNSRLSGTIAALITLKTPNSITAHTLFTWMQEQNLSEDRMPQLIKIKKELPHGSTGKIKFFECQTKASKDFDQKRENTGRRFEMELKK